MNKENRRNQGDVIVVPIGALPADAKPIKGATLALGEHTGHSHSFFNSIDSTAVKFLNNDNHFNDNVQLFEDTAKVLYAKIDNVIYLKHQEHNPIQYDPGLYRIGIIREYDYDEEESKRVVD